MYVEENALTFRGCMTDYFDIELSDGELQGMSTLGLAHIGDGVYELLVRTRLCADGTHTSKNLHKETVGYVCAAFQARAAKKIAPMLTEQEQAVFRRGKNAKVNSVPKNADIADYHAATGLEALFGYLWLKGSKGRVNELFAAIMED